eukprot:CAMPEP_0182824602 /NCGR_PEP_ID=MMETSP0006_2-20121128/15380_1 /TAXON_ID=97485 /ORGANISM="Prymnesium parvum, Strain Texoma1" /LENGTH=78 /DNA_ID=CAMNT_0024951615 /DNA_START=422 /DNA_END=657 /DNA_ORIENTATION=+
MTARMSTEYSDMRGSSEVILEVDLVVAAEDCLDAEVAIRQAGEALDLREDVDLHPNLHRQVFAVHVAKGVVLRLDLVP